MVFELERFENYIIVKTFFLFDDDNFETTLQKNYWMNFQNKKEFANFKCFLCNKLIYLTIFSVRTLKFFCFNSDIFETP